MSLVMTQIKNCEIGLFVATFRPGWGRKSGQAGRENPEAAALDTLRKRNGFFN
jgi:hypothetical protein